MRVINGVIGGVLLALAVLHAFIPHAASLTLMSLYGVGAMLALLTWSNNISLGLARVLAIGTTAVMFFYFAGFFKMAPHFSETWYMSGDALEAVGLLLSAFAMIPVLSSYSCLLKAECREAMEKDTSRRAFFSVPEQVQKKA